MMDGPVTAADRALAQEIQVDLNLAELSFGPNLDQIAKDYAAGTIDSVFTKGKGARTADIDPKLQDTQVAMESILAAEADNILSMISQKHNAVTASKVIGALNKLLQADTAELNDMAQIYNKSVEQVKLENLREIHKRVAEHGFTMQTYEKNACGAASQFEILFGEDPALAIQTSVDLLVDASATNNGVTLERNDAGLNLPGDKRNMLAQTIQATMMHYAVDITENAYAYNPENDTFLYDRVNSDGSVKTVLMSGTCDVMMKKAVESYTGIKTFHADTSHFDLDLGDKISDQLVDYTKLLTKYLSEDENGRFDLDNDAKSVLDPKNLKRRVNVGVVFDRPGAHGHHNLNAVGVIFRKDGTRLTILQDQFDDDVFTVMDDTEFSTSVMFGISRKDFEHGQSEITVAERLNAIADKKRDLNDPAHIVVDGRVAIALNTPPNIMRSDSLVIEESAPKAAKMTYSEIESGFSLDYDAEAQADGQPRLLSNKEMQDIILYYHNKPEVSLARNSQSQTKLTEKRQGRGSEQEEGASLAEKALWS